MRKKTTLKQSLLILSQSFERWSDRSDKARVMHQFQQHRDRLMLVFAQQHELRHARVGSGQLTRGAEMDERAWRLCVKWNGANDPQTARAASNYASVLRALHRDAVADAVLAGRVVPTSAPVTRPDPN